MKFLDKSPMVNFGKLLPEEDVKGSFAKDDIKQKILSHRD